MDAQQEVRVDQDSFQRELNPVVEASAIAPADIEEFEQRPRVCFRHRPAIGEPRQSGKNLRGAGPLFRCKPRLADENRAPAGSVPRRAGGPVRTSNLDGADVGVIHVHLVIGDDPAPLQRLRQSFRFPQLPHERHADNAGTRLDRDADLDPGVSGKLHVLFPLGIAGKAWLSAAGPTGCGGPALGPASYGEPLQQLPIQPNVESLRPPNAFEVILILPLQTNFDQVLAVDRKVVANRDAAPGSERQIFALPVVLQHVQRDGEGLERGTGRRKTRREPGDLTGDRHVSLQVGRRNREDIRKVVETAVRRLIPGE